MLDDDKVVVVRVLRHGVSQQTVMQRLAKGQTQSFSASSPSQTSAEKDYSAQMISSGKAELLVLAKEGSDDGSVTNAYTNTCSMMNCKFF